MALRSPQCQLPGGTQSLLAWCRDRLLGVETEAWTGWVPSDARELRSERVRPPPRIRKPRVSKAHKSLDCKEQIKKEDG